MDSFYLEECSFSDYSDENSPDLSTLKKEELIDKVKQLTEDNDSLKRNLTELKEKYKIHLASFAKEIEQLKHKLNEKGHIDEYTKDIFPKDQGRSYSSTYGTPSAFSAINSQCSESLRENEKENALEITNTPPEKCIDEEEKLVAQLKMSNFMREMIKSPSVVLMKRDAQYYDKSVNPLKSTQTKESKVWKSQILPLLKDKDQKKLIRTKIKTLIYDFIPGKYRGQIWPLLIGNPLKMRKSIYKTLLQSMEACPLDSKSKNQIKEDLTRTYPQLKSFNRGETLNEELQILLELFHFARPDIGYVQGMAYPASMLLLYMDQYHAFKCLMNLVVHRPFLTKLYKFELEEIKVMCRVFERLLKQKAPLAHKHLEKMNISSEVYLIEWLVTLFCRNFHLNETAKIWDLFLYEGEVALIKIALRVFHLIEHELIKKDYAESLYFLRSCTAEIDPSLLFKNFQTSKLTQQKLEKYYERVKNKKKDGVWDIFN